MHGFVKLEQWETVHEFNRKYIIVRNHNYIGKGCYEDTEGVLIVLSI